MANTNAIIKFEQEFMSRGPTDVRASILRDRILIRLKGVLTRAERQLAKSEEGIGMVKQSPKISSLKKENNLAVKSWGSPAGKRLPCLRISIPVSKNTSSSWP